MLAKPNRRKQLTLFVPAPWRAELEALRRVLDPIQASLIAAHVTLCREDEIEGLGQAAIFSRIEAWSNGPLSMSFGPPQRFGGHGVLMPCTQGTDQFHRLRAWLLQGQGLREHGAHLTLAHPRNPRALGNIEDALSACPEQLHLQFAAVALIEQEGHAPWSILRQSTLGGSACRIA